MKKEDCNTFEFVKVEFELKVRKEDYTEHSNLCDDAFTQMTEDVVLDILGKIECKLEYVFFNRYKIRLKNAINLGFKLEKQHDNHWTHFFVNNERLISFSKLTIIESRETFKTEVIFY